MAGSRNLSHDGINNVEALKGLYFPLRENGRHMSVVRNTLLEYGLLDSVFDDIAYINDTEYHKWIAGQPQPIKVTRTFGKQAIENALSLYNQHHMLTDQSPRHVVRAGGAIIVPLGKHTDAFNHAVRALNEAKDNIHEFLNQACPVTKQAMFDRHHKKRFVENAIGKATQLMQLYRHIPIYTKPIKSISSSWLTKEVPEMLNHEQFVARYTAAPISQSVKQIFDEHIKAINQGKPYFDAYQRYKVQQAANMATITFYDNTRSKQNVSLPIIVAGNTLEQPCTIHTMRDYLPGQEITKNNLKPTKRYSRHDIGLENVVGVNYFK